MGRAGRALLGCALAATSVALLAPAATPAAKSLGTFKVLDGRYSQRVEVDATYHSNDGCYDEYHSLTGTSEYALQPVRGVKVKAKRSYFDSITLAGLEFTGAGEEGLSQFTGYNGPFAEDCPQPSTPAEFDTSACGTERIDPPTKLELTEAGNAPSTASFFSPGGGLAPFGPLSDPDGSAFACPTGSNWDAVTFPAPSKVKRGKLLRAEEPIKLRGDASYFGQEGLSDCFCDRIEGGNSVETDWSLKLKPLG
jgi:hypothetical protein